MAGARALVIGAGIVGICAALALTRKGLRVTVTDPEPPGTMTSYGNAGGFGVTEVMPLSAPGLIRRLPRWLIDPLGPVCLRGRHLPTLLPWLWRFYRAGTLSEVRRIARAQAALLAPTYDDYKPLLRAAGIEGLHVERGALTVYKSEAALARDALEWEIKHEHGIRCERVGADDIRALEPALSPQLHCGVFTPQWSHVRDPTGW